MFRLIKEITDADLGIGPNVEFGRKYELRKTARAILLNKDEQIATVFLARDNFHKLPGGGLETTEDLDSALQREIQEEVGCACKIVEELGVVIEYRAKYDLLQISYGFVATLVGEIKNPTLDDKEIEEGLQIEWLTAHSALEIMKREKPTRYEGGFILAREIAFLESYLNR
jgi:8-oxo-dGTP diphosphatase